MAVEGQPLPDASVRTQGWPAWLIFHSAFSAGDGDDPLVRHPRLL